MTGLPPEIYALLLGVTCRFVKNCTLRRFFCGHLNPDADRLPGEHFRLVRLLRK
jgi:hypothetical protein